MTLPNVAPSLNEITKTLPTIPPEIQSLTGLPIDTTGPNWRFPPHWQATPVNWSMFNATQEILAVIKGYVAHKITDKAERTASNEGFRLSKVNWIQLTDPWQRTGAISLANVLTVEADLKKRFPGVWADYFGAVKRMYTWATEQGVPGFSKDDAFQIGRVNPRKRPPLDSRTRVAPGVAVSKASKNRRKYDHRTMTNIEIALILTVRDLQAGKAKRWVTLSKVVMTYLAADHGARPGMFAKLRESHFEARETEGAICYWIGIPDNKGQKKRQYIYHLRWRELSTTWGSLIGDLIAENRAAREVLGFDNTLDWPLFHIALTGLGTGNLKQRLALHLDDPVLKFHKSGKLLSRDLQSLFAVLQVKDSDGNILVPTFYSFRETKDSNLAALGAPLVERAEQLGQTTTISTPRYDKRGKEFAAMMSQSPLREKLEAMAQPFRERIKLSESGSDGPEVPLFHPETGTFIGVSGRCGCPGSPCGLSGTIECYICGNHRYIPDGPHAIVLELMQDRRLRMKKEGKPESQYRRYDLYIGVVEEILNQIALGKVAVE